MISRWSFFGFYQPAVGTVAVGVILRTPAAADRDSCGFVKFENMGLDVGAGVRTVTKWWILRARAAAVGDAFGDLFDDRWFDEVVV